jgi:hypothetical protein
MFGIKRGPSGEIEMIGRLEARGVLRRSLY